MDNVAVYNNNDDDDNDDDLRETVTYEGPFAVALELSFVSYTGSVPGPYHFEVSAVSSSCDCCLCHISRSPVGKFYVTFS
jgi:hypothetical protein